MILIAPETLQIFAQIEDGIAQACTNQLTLDYLTPQYRLQLEHTRALAQCRAEMLSHMVAEARKAGFE